MVFQNVQFSTRKKENNMNSEKIRIMRELFDHIIELHTIGVIATREKVEEEKKECDEAKTLEDYYREFADQTIATISELAERSITDSSNRHVGFEEAINKNRRRISWMKMNPDSGITKIELWKKSKKEVG